MQILIWNDDKNSEVHFVCYHSRLWNQDDVSSPPTCSTSYLWKAQWRHEFDVSGCCTECFNKSPEKKSRGSGPVILQTKEFGRYDLSICQVMSVKCLPHTQSLCGGAPSCWKVYLAGILPAGENKIVQHYKIIDSMHCFFSAKENGPITRLHINNTTRLIFRLSLSNSINSFGLCNVQILVS